MGRRKPSTRRGNAARLRRALPGQRIGVCNLLTLLQLFGGRFDSALVAHGTDFAFGRTSKRAEGVTGPTGFSRKCVAYGLFNLKESDRGGSVKPTYCNRGSKKGRLP